MKYLKYTLPLIILVCFATAHSAQALCCNTIQLRGRGPNVSSVSEVSDAKACEAICDSYILGNCVAVSWPGATTDKADNACLLNGITGCCEVSISGKPTYAYWSNDQNECNNFCKLTLSCNSLYKRGQSPDKSYHVCTNTPPPGTSATGGSTPPTGTGSTPAAPIYQFTIPTDPLKYAAYSPSKFLAKIISGLLLILGTIALLMFLYAGFLWMTARGDGAKVKKATSILIWSTAGLVIIFVSYIAVGYILEVASSI